MTRLALALALAAIGACGGEPDTATPPTRTPGAVADARGGGGTRLPGDPIVGAGPDAAPPVPDAGAPTPTPPPPDAGAPAPTPDAAPVPSPPPFMYWPTNTTPAYCVGVPGWHGGDYKPGDEVTDVAGMAPADVRYVHLFACNPLPQGNWCSIPGYEPAQNGPWRDAWTDLGTCQ